MVELKNLSFGYKKGNFFLDGLELQLKPGNINGLFGMNGAGKTTLLKLITGGLFPKSGVCKIIGLDTTKRNPNMLKDIFIIPEEFDLPSISVKKYVELHAGFYPEFDNEKFKKLTKEFSVDRHSKLNELSYGQKKKFLINLNKELLWKQQIF